MPMLILSGISLGATILIFASGSLFARSRNYLFYGLTRWSFAEVAGILGLTLFYSGASWAIFGIFLGWSALLLLALMPTQRDQEQFQKLKEQG